MNPPHDTAAAVLIVAALGLLLGLGLLAGLALAVRRLARDAAGLALLVVLAVALAWLVQRDLTVLPTAGDEIVNLCETLIAMVSPLRMTRYPHPSGNFTLSASLFALPIVGSAWAQGADLLATIADWLLTQHLVALVLARVLSSLAWVALAGLCAWAVRRLTGDAWLGLVAAAAAIGPNVSYATSLSPYSLGIGLAWAALFVVLWGERDEALTDRRALLAGALAGASFGVLYLGAMVLPWALVAGLSLRGTRRGRATLLFGAAALVAFVLVNTTLLTDFSGHLDMWGYRAREVASFDENAEGAALAPEKGRAAFYLQHLALWHGFPVVALGVLAGAVLAVRRRDRRLAWVVAVPLLALVELSAVATRKEQYVLVALPGLAIVAAAWLAPVLARLPWAPARGAVRLAGVVFFAWANVGQPLAPRVDGGGTLLGTDAAARLFERISRETGPGDRVVLDTPNLSWPVAAQMRLASPDLASAVAARVKDLTGRELVFSCAEVGDCWWGARWLYQVSMTVLEPPRVPPSLRAEPLPAERWGTNHLAGFRLATAPVP
jgi:hypothetical protein